MPIECLPVPHVPLGYLVQRLSLSSLLLLFRLALLERKVVLRSSSAFTLAACGEAITSLLLFPFRWQCAFSVFDLDVGEVEIESAAVRLPELPSSVQARLRAGVSRLMANTGIEALTAK
ncbi:Crag, partial [Symbiodinium necroappetens]